MVRHLILILLITCIFWFLGAKLPTFLQQEPEAWLLQTELDSMDQDSLTSDSSADSVIDTVSFQTRIQQALPVLQVRPPWRNRPAVWVLGRGVSFPVYALRAQRAIQQEGGTLLRMKEQNHQSTPSIYLQYLSPQGDTNEVQLRLGEEYLQSSSKIAILFAVDSSLSIATLNQLHSLEQPFNLLIQPFDTSKALRYDLDKLPAFEGIAWMAMEPKHYPWVDPGPQAILIHHNEEQVSSIIHQAQKALPQIQGIATRMGQRAMEHRPLLTALLHELNKQKLWFLDLSENKFSKSLEVCQTQNVVCRQEKIDSGKEMQKYLGKQLHKAIRSGSSLVILHASQESVLAVQNWLPTVKARGVEIVKLSQIMSHMD